MVQKVFTPSQSSNPAALISEGLIDLELEKAELLKEDDPVEAGTWEAGITKDGRVFVESSDFSHDVRLYVDGDFSSPSQKLKYAKLIANRLNKANSL